MLRYLFWAFFIVPVLGDFLNEFNDEACPVPDGLDAFNDGGISPDHDVHSNTSPDDDLHLDDNDAEDYTCPLCLGIVNAVENELGDRSNIGCCWCTLSRRCMSCEHSQTLCDNEIVLDIDQSAECPQPTATPTQTPPISPFTAQPTESPQGTCKGHCGFFGHLPGLPGTKICECNPYCTFLVDAGGPLIDGTLACCSDWESECNNN